MFTKVSYIIIYISFVIFAIGVITPLVKKLRSGSFEFNPLCIFKNFISLNGLRTKESGVWYSAQVMHLGLFFCIAHDILLNTHSAALIPAARILIIIGGVVAVIGLIGLIYMAYAKEAFFFYNKLSLILLLGVMVFMWVAIIDTYGGPGFETISKAMKTFTADGVPYSITLSTVTGAAYAGYLVFTVTIKQYIDSLLSRKS